MYRRFTIPETVAQLEEAVLKESAEYKTFLIRELNHAKKMRGYHQKVDKKYRDRRKEERQQEVITAQQQQETLEHDLEKEREERQRLEQEKEKQIEKEKQQQIQKEKQKTSIPITSLSFNHPAPPDQHKYPTIINNTRQAKRPLPQFQSPPMNP